MTQPDFAARNQVTVLLRERADALTVHWLGATGAVGTLAVVLTILAKSMPEPVAGFVSALAWLVAGLLAVLSVVLPQRQLADPHLAKWLRAPVEPYRWAKQMRLKPAKKAVFMALPPPEQSLLALTIPFVRPYLLALGLSLGVALVGFVYGLMSRAVLEAAPFLVGALALNCWHYPRLSKLIDRGRTLQVGVQDEEDARALADFHDRRDGADEKAASPNPQRTSQVSPNPQRTSQVSPNPQRSPQNTPKAQRKARTNEQP